MQGVGLSLVNDTSETSFSKVIFSGDCVIAATQDEVVEFSGTKVLRRVDLDSEPAYLCTCPVPRYVVERPCLCTFFVGVLSSRLFLKL